MRSILQGMVVLGCLTSARAGFADSTAEAPYKFVLPKNHDARDHMKRGVRLYEIQSFDAAIEEFKAGALAEPCSTFDYNLGQSYRQLGRYKEALWHYQRFLNYGNPTGEVLDAVQKWITEMQAHLANAARTMPPTEAAPATQPETSTAPMAPMARRAAPNPMQTTMPRDHGTPDSAQGDNGGGSVNWIGWTATAAGVAALGTTGYLFLRASNFDDQANMNIDNHTRSDLHDQASSRRLAGAIVGVVGVALTATGVYLLATSHPRAHSSTASLDVGITGHGVVVFGRY